MTPFVKYTYAETLANMHVKKEILSAIENSRNTYSETVSEMIENNLYVGDLEDELLEIYPELSFGEAIKKQPTTPLIMMVFNQYLDTVINNGLWEQIKKIIRWDLSNGLIENYVNEMI